MRIPHNEMADAFDRMIYGKEKWILDCSEGKHKRPEHELDTQRRNLAVLKQAAADYRAAATREVAA